ncbi:thiosulfate oxidation carrier complex protein SoxZ [Sedimenticola selenatireducens]|jgi:sulfur-oxidizing protein SoxZ|uniref:Thiosulfate oxidation carrier complex protein SoxZ n=1 Tax=Sedimenticola selenatireducens TaxID=191960 RepID=A0A558DWJ6_9GAMM|nr:thiosulfate oxidation carrier complex protein SoxZ [Sedimenticola selenatireducens]TVO75516.1 thiosulfate oxidation carrier complex protein SoxZ [Sedimenticola selenatireducens]TVT65422.1 MAG: thiosulfate oxidation carrier complex protein SoxZ [Sedimenticola selenatireducens]
MASNSIKIRAKIKEDEVTVKALMTHPMETGNRKDSKGATIPAHFIQEVTCASAGKDILTADWSGGISKNPYISFKYKGASAGDDLTLTWVDNLGNTESATVKVE